MASTRNVLGRLNVCPEVRLLLACARTVASDEAAADIRALIHEKLHWSYIIDCASRHRVLPLLYHQLSRHAPTAVPAEITALLGLCSTQITRHNLLLTAQLLALVELLGSNAIPALPYKGPTLAILAYSSLGLRTFDDLDILIQRSDFKRARDLLAARGFKALFALDSREEDEYVKRHHDYFFQHGDGVCVELQWGVIQEPFALLLDSGLGWAGQETVMIAGTQVTTMAAEDLLLVLCVHGSKHQWDRLIWVCDIAELLRARPDIDLGRALRRAERLGISRMLMLGLFLAHTMVGAPLPEAYLLCITSERIVPVLAQQVWEELVRDSATQPMTLERAPLFYLRMLDRWPSRAWLCLHLAPGALRPVRLARRYGLSPLKHLLGH
jgi:hypothetical protein